MTVRGGALRVAGVPFEFSRHGDRRLDLGKDLAVRLADRQHASVIGGRRWPRPEILVRIISAAAITASTLVRT